MNLIEILDPEAGLRYGLCRNRTGKLKDDKPRQELLARTRTNLDKIVNDKGQNEDGDLGILIGKVINQIKVGKFLTTLIQNGTISWSSYECKSALGIKANKGRRVTNFN